MHPSMIKAALSQVGSSQRQVAEEVGVRETVVSAVVNAKSRSSRVEQRIAEITDIPLYYLWPQWHKAPETAPADFDPTQLNVDLLEAVERHLAAALMARIPGLAPPFNVRARHRVAVYNACVKRGTIAIETGAGTADEVAHFLAHWAENYEQTTGEKPTPEALRKWALADGGDAGPTAAGATTVRASGGSVAAGRDVNFGAPTPTRR